MQVSIKPETDSRADRWWGSGHYSPTSQSPATPTCFTDTLQLDQGLEGLLVTVMQQFGSPLS